MRENRKSPAGTQAPAPVAPLVVRDARTGRVVSVRGVGALRDSTFRIREDISLLEPIAEQVATRRSGSDAND